MFRLLFLPLLLLLVLAGAAQRRPPRLNELFDRYRKSGRDTNRVKTLLTIDSQYLYRMPKENQYIDSATVLVQEALDLSISLHYSMGEEHARYMLGNCLILRKDLPPIMAYINGSKGWVKVQMLVKMGEIYLFRPGELKENLDSVYPFARWACDYSDSIHRPELLHQSLCLLGKYYFSRGDMAGAKKSFMQIIDDCHRAKNIPEEAHWWDDYGNYMPDTDSTYAEEVRAFQNARVLYLRCGDLGNSSSMLGNVAFLHDRHHELDKAEAEYEEGIRLRKAIPGAEPSMGMYLGLTQLHLAKGNYNKSLKYALEAVDIVNSEKDDRLAGMFYFSLAESYRALGEKDKCLPWYRLALDRIDMYKDVTFFAIAGRLTHALLDLGRPEEALTFLKEFIRKNSPIRLSDKQIVAQSLGDCYNVLGEYELAEKNYLRMIELGKLEQAHKNTEMISNYLMDVLTQPEAYYTIGRFYIQRGRYATARPYLEKALIVDLFSPPLALMAQIQDQLYKVDSADGHYLAAIEHLRKGQVLKDSVFNIAKTREIADIQTKYETDEKDKDLKVLRSAEALQRQQLQKTAQTRNFTFILVIVLLILIGVGYSRYRLKQRSNQLLQTQRQEIQSQFLAVRELNGIQEKLLTEKEWLVKEIHHRVKNNLQIVISLLNAQSEFLDNASALDAIRESRERMQAIALIHQKLYQPDQSTMIDMPSYIRELVSNLRDGFTGSEDIHFGLEVDPIELDVSQTVPLGLILNEAITNAIKYAFPREERMQQPHVNISLTRTDAKHLFLKIADNGRGLPASFDLSGSNSLGVQLMKLFSEQLEGELSFQNKEGLEIRLLFDPWGSSVVDKQGVLNEMG